MDQACGTIEPDLAHFFILLNNHRGEGLLLPIGLCWGKIDVPWIAGNLTPKADVRNPLL